MRPTDDFETLAQNAEQAHRCGETRTEREPVPHLLERFSEALGLTGRWVRVDETDNTTTTAETATDVE